MRRSQEKLKSPMRRMGSGIYQYGTGFRGIQDGTGVTPYGGGITPYGGAIFGSGTPLRRMGGSGIKDLFRKGIKSIKNYFKKQGPTLAKAVVSTAAEAASGLLSGKSPKEVAGSVADKAASAAIKQLSGTKVGSIAAPLAESAYQKGKKKIGLGRQMGGTSPLRPAAGELSAGQLRYLQKRAQRDPADKPPVFDRHELQMFGNIIQGKQIIGGGMMKQ